MLGLEKGHKLKQYLDEDKMLKKEMIAMNDSERILNVSYSPRAPHELFIVTV